MAKITLSPLTSGFQTIGSLNTSLDSIEAEFQDKVLYRTNPTGEPNQMNNDLDMNGYSILNIGNLSALISATYSTAIIFGTQYDGTGTHSLSVGCVYRTTEISGSVTVCLSLNTELNAGWATGNWMTFIQKGAAPIKIVAESGVTLRTPETVRSGVRYGQIKLTYRGGDIWYLSGDLETTV